VDFLKQEMQGKNFRISCEGFFRKPVSGCGGPTAWDWWMLSSAMYSTLSGRIAVLTYSGGAGIVSADFIEKSGLKVAELSSETRQSLKTVFPDWMLISNPIDLWPAVEKSGGEKTYRAAIEAVCADPGVDAIFLHLFAGGFALNFDLSLVADRVKSSGKPVIVWLIGEQNIRHRYSGGLGENRRYPV
jgi:acyl-CoA synthetase (NDP forming)